MHLISVGIVLDAYNCRCSTIESLCQHEYRESADSLMNHEVSQVLLCGDNYKFKTALLVKSCVVSHKVRQQFCIVNKIGSGRRQSWPFQCSHRHLHVNYAKY